MDQDVPTPDILDRFGSDPRPRARPARMVVDRGQCLIRDPPVEAYPRQRAFPEDAKKGELARLADVMDTATLCFQVYSDESADNSSQLHRIRMYKLYYHLSDDTLSLYEPHVENSGYIQGRLFRHQRVPAHNRVGSPYLHYTDLNLGMDISLFGTRYRIYDCDNFTHKFLSERGVKLSPAEDPPMDPWIAGRRRRRRETPSAQPPVEQRPFLPAPAVLTFRCCWLDHGNDFCGCRVTRIFRIMVFTADHTVSLVEETKEFEGQLFLKRMRLPCPSEPGVVRHYRYWDIRPGVWIEVFSRAMFVFECVGGETVDFIRQQFGEIDFRNCTGDVLREGPPPRHFDTAPAQLRFVARMIDPPVMFYDTRFVLTFDIDKKTIDVCEGGRLRKWSTGRAFLTSVNAHTFSENQFFVTGVIALFRWRFRLDEADPRTAEYLRFKGQTA